MGIEYFLWSIHSTAIYLIVSLISPITEAKSKGISTFIAGIYLVIQMLPGT